MVNVLVTGGAGYIGSILCQRLLEAGHHVTVLDNLAYNQQSLFNLCANPRFDFIRGDARDEELVRRSIKNADVLIPLAAVVGAPACARDPWLAESLNLEAVRMLNRLRSPDQLVIYPNTNSGYGTTSGDVLCTEDTPMNSISIYGRTKTQAELELLETSNTITLRLATVFPVAAAA